MKPRRARPILLQSTDESHWVNRRAVGIGVFVGFFVAFAGYLLTGSGWWFVAPIVGFAIAWRLVFGRWPFIDRST